MKILNIKNLNRKEKKIIIKYWTGIRNKSKNYGIK